MEKVKLSKHLLEDRSDRVTFILMHTGIGTVIYEKLKEGRRLCLTDEGVVLVKGIDDTIITMYYAEMAQARFACEEERIPKAVKSAIERNIKKGWLTAQNTTKY